MWFELKGDERITRRCASEGCHRQPTWKLEADGAGSFYCSGCKAMIEEPDNYEKAMRSLVETFGYRPDERGGEQWTVYRDEALIVIHPERRPRVYERGCGGIYAEIEPVLS